MKTRTTTRKLIMTTAAFRARLGMLLTFQMKRAGVWCRTAVIVTLS
jgi:hypothetical protein